MSRLPRDAGGPHRPRRRRAPGEVRQAGLPEDVRGGRSRRPSASRGRSAGRAGRQRDDESVAQLLPPSRCRTHGQGVPRRRWRRSQPGPAGGVRGQAARRPQVEDMLRPRRWPSTGSTAPTGGMNGDRAGARHAKGRFYEGTFTAPRRWPASPARPTLRGAPGPGDGALVERRAATRALRQGARRGGMAVKFRTPSGDTDLLGQTAPRFPVRTPEALRRAHRGRAQDRTSCRCSWPSTRSSVPVGRPRRLRPISGRGRSCLTRSYAEATYFPIHAAACWSTRRGTHLGGSLGSVLRPLATPADRLGESFDGRDRLFDEMGARLNAASASTSPCRAADGRRPHDPMSAARAPASSAPAPSR